MITDKDRQLLTTITQNATDDWSLGLLGIRQHQGNGAIARSILDLNERLERIEERMEQ